MTDKKENNQVRKSNLPAIPHLTAEFIMYGIAGANAARLAWAWAYADAGGDVRSLPGISGAMMGLTISLSTAFIAAKIAAWKRKEPPTMAWVGLGVLAILEPIILTPLTVSDMPATLSAHLPQPFNIIWAASLALAPSIAMIAVAFAGGAIVDQSKPAQPAAQPAQAQAQTTQPAAQPEQAPQSAPAPAQTSTQAPQLASAEPQSAPQPAVQPAQPSGQDGAAKKIYTCAICGMSYTNAGGHYKAHHRKPVAIDPSLLISQERE